MKLSDDERQGTAAEPSVCFHDVAPALEFICWVIAALAPVLRYVNGPPVTDDQFVIQIGLGSLAATSAVALRIYNARARRRSQ
jgi:hypothetical protein